MRSRAAVLLALAPLLLGGCDGDDPEGDAGPLVDAGAMDAGAGASDPPTVRDVRIDLTGVTDLTVDLGAASSETILPEPTASEWIVQVRDDVTAPDALDVTIASPDGAPLADQSPLFERGNWRITATVSPGDELTVRVEDEDGNVTIHDQTLRVPTLEEALVDAWEQRDHGLDQSIVARADVELLADGTWTWSGPALGRSRGGTFEVTGATLLFEERTDSAGDTDPATVERADEGPFFVDSRFLSRAPWQRADATTGAEGTFERSWTHTEGGAPATVEETLTLGGDGSYAWTRTLDGAPDGSAEGTFVVELTQNYEDSLGDFLRVTETRRDGMDLAVPEERLDLFIDLEDRLLIDPLIRVLP